MDDVDFYFNDINLIGFESVRETKDGVVFFPPFPFSTLPLSSVMRALNSWLS